MGQENSTNLKSENTNEHSQNNPTNKLAVEITDYFVDVSDEVKKNANNDDAKHPSAEHAPIEHTDVLNQNIAQENIDIEQIQENLNHFKYWTLHEERNLLDKIDKHTLDELAKIHGRTKGAIEAKLKKIYMESIEKNNPNTQIEKLINVKNIKKYSVAKKDVRDDTLSIYIIKCQHDKYYIGKSKNLENRILEHFQEIGSAWTSLHKPIEVIETIKNADSFDEDKYTKIYMAKYGIDNVRGGSYVQISLDLDVKKYLEKEINSTYDYCHRCGRTDHFINRCYANVHIDGTKLSNPTDKSHTINHPKLHKKDTKIKNNKIVDNAILESPNEKNPSDYCTKCGRKGHTKESCYAKKHVKGFYIK